MGIRKVNPTSPGRRFQTYSTFEEITKTGPERSLLEPLKKTGGRNNAGRVTAWQKGGGHKRRYRIVDFKRDKEAIPAKVASIEYDPNRSAHIALLNYADGEKRYILAPVGLKVGSAVTTGKDADIKPGNCLRLVNIPLGTVVHNVELKPGKGGQLARSIGSWAKSPLPLNTARGTRKESTLCRSSSPARFAAEETVTNSVLAVKNAVPVRMREN